MIWSDDLGQCVSMMPKSTEDLMFGNLEKSAKIQKRSLGRTMKNTRIAVGGQGHGSGNTHPLAPKWAKQRTRTHNRGGRRSRGRGWNTRRRWNNRGRYPDGEPYYF